MAREFAKQFYKSSAWLACREAYLARRHYLCEDCLARGIYTPATTVHHIEALTPLNIHTPEITLGFSNLRAVCRDCHAKEHKRKRETRYEILPDGSVVV